MARVKRSKIRRTRIKRIFKLAKGFRGARSKLLRTAINAVTKAQQYAYRDRRNRKRDFRRLWIARINAAARLNGTSYAALMGKLKKADIQVNRKMLSEIAIVDPAAFTAIVQAAG
jgi:large subunit ribosomal protein L20